MVDSGKEISRQQNHYGSGPLIGGHNYGPISYEMLDRQTKSMLAKLSEKAPELAALLTKALSDGIISPDVADALMLAVRHINEDVASALILAGQNINEDVASALTHAGKVNEDVAARLVRINEELSETADKFDRILNVTSRQINGLQGEWNRDHQLSPAVTVTGTARRTAQVVTRPSPWIPENWNFRFKLILWSFAAGLAIGAALVYHFKR